MSPEEGERRAGRFLHHVAHLAREDEISLPGHEARFDEEDVAPVLGPGQAHGDAHLILAQDLSLLVARNSEERFSNLGSDDQALSDPAFDDAVSHLAAKRPPLARGSGRLACV